MDGKLDMKVGTRVEGYRRGIRYYLVSYLWRRILKSRINCVWAYILWKMCFITFLQT